jgi:hypothetical protein
MNTLVTSNTIETPQAPKGPEHGSETWNDLTGPALNRLKSSPPLKATGKRLSSDVTACSTTNDYAYEIDEAEELDEIKEAGEAKEFEEPEGPKEAKESKTAKQIRQATDSSNPAQRQEIGKLSPDLSERIDAAICHYRVLSYGEFNHPLFMLAQEVRSIEAEPNISFSTDVTVDIAKRWQASNQTNLDNEHDYVAEFLGRLDLVRFPKGGLVRAVKIAGTIPAPKQTIILSSQCQSLAKLCCVLQRQAGNEPFFLDGRSAATVLDIPHSTVVIWLRGLCRLKVIMLVSKGSRGKASRYRYIAE